MGPVDELKSCAAEASAWLLEAAAPRWSGPGLHPDGMFAEALTLDGRATDKDRRIRVQARQIYAFCELGRLGWGGPWQEIVSGAVDILLARGKRADGFFVHRFDNKGQPFDHRADLYDTAFLLFAFGHAGKALDRPDLFAESRELFDAVELAWTNRFGGYEEGEIDVLPRRQNPHMHLLEASIVQWQATGDSAWSSRVEALRSLALSRFIDQDTFALTEFFSHDWSRPETEEGRTVEPGHCFEWSWLFEIIGEQGLGDLAPSDGLARFARTQGLTPDRTFAINAVSLDGKIIDAGARLWPQTERLKAALARWRRTRETSEIVEAVSAYHGLTHYFNAPIPGLWRDKRRPDGSFVTEDVPASSFYHIVCALSELIETVRRLN
jgi:mannose-6-phosphate isomerase